MDRASAEAYEDAVRGVAEGDRVSIETGDGGSEAIAAPTLVTERLVLRPHRADDFEDVAAMWADPAVVGAIPKPPSSAEESWGRLLRYSGLWSLLGFGYWAVRERGAERFVGDVGFADFRRTVTPSLDGTRECGWVLAAWAHGRGYASEALAAALAWHDTNAPGVATTCMIDPANAGSLRVAEKAGFARWTCAAYGGGPVVLLRRPAGGLPVSRAAR